MSEPKERETINFGAGATATPTPTKTPTPSSRVRQFADGKWYVIDANGTAVSPGYRTQAMAVNAAEFTYPTTPAAPEGGEEGAAAAMSLLNRLMGTNLALQGPGDQTLSAEGVQGTPAPKTGGPSSSGTGTGTAAKATKPGVPDHLKGWFDLFKGLDDKAIVEAYYNGEEGLDRNILGQLLAYRNMDDKGVSKWTEASLGRYLDQIDAEKPLGIRKADIAEQFDPSRADFGARGTFGSGSLGQGNREEGMFTPNSQGFGLVPASDQSGNLWPAAAVVNNQLYPAASAGTGGPQDAMRAFYNGISGIAAQRGMKPGSGLADIGQSLSEQNRMMEVYGADPSRAMLATQVASGAYNPANQRIDPASGRPAGEMNEEELLRLSGQGVFRAQGGPVRAGQPYIVGEKRPEVFVPEQNGQIIPRVPEYDSRLGDPRSGMIGTPNPRLAAENPRRYFNQPLPPLMTPFGDTGMLGNYSGKRFPQVAGKGSQSIFEKALMASMKRQPMGMMG